MKNAVRALVPMAFVKSVPESAVFYARLGFQIENTFTPKDQAEPTWVFLTSGRAQLMLARASHPVVASEQAVLFYAYCPDVRALREELLSHGVAAGPIETPFYAPRGEFRIVDPDGYAIMVTHT